MRVRFLLPFFLALGGPASPASAMHSGESGFSSIPASEIWTGAVLLFAAILWLALRRTPWREAAAWAALALAGQACALQLLWVGSSIHLQMFQSWWVLLKTYRLVFLLAVLAQTVLVVWGARTFWPGWRARGSRFISWPQAIAFAALWTYASTTIAPGVAQALVHGGIGGQLLVQSSKFALGLLVFAAGALNLALAAAAIPDEACAAIRRRWETADRRKLPLLCALWVVLVSSLLAWLALDRIPHLGDETAYLFQAKHIAAGRLTLPLPPDAKALYCPFQLTDESRWYNAAPAGWSFFLALGVLVGLPWLVNPLLGGIAVLLSHVVVRRLYDRASADGVVLLLAASPWLLFLSASLMPHPMTLVLSMAGLLGVIRAREEGSAAGGALAGLCFGALLHVRPLEAVVMAAVCGLWWLGAGWPRFYRGRRKLRPVALLATAVCGMAMTALFLAYNQHLTGDPFRVPINKYADETYQEGVNRLGFGPNVGNVGWTGLDALPGHGPIDVFMNTNQNLHMVQFELFGWACGSLLFASLFLVWRAAAGGDRLMWALVAAIAAAMSLYWFGGGPDFGARYWYQMIVPFTVLTLRGAQEFLSRWKESVAVGAGLSRPAFSDSAASDGGIRVWVFLGLASLLALTNVLPWRSLDKYHHYRSMRPDFRALARQHDFGRSLVFVRGKLRPDYMMAYPFNPPVFDRDVPGTIYAHELGPDSVTRLRSYYSDRPIWIVAGPTVTGAAPQVVAGPIPPGQPYPSIPPP